MESPGTRAFTRAEVREMLRGAPVDQLRFNADGFREMAPPAAPTLPSYFKYLIRCLLTLAIGFNKADFFMKIEFNRAERNRGAGMHPILLGTNERQAMGRAARATATAAPHERRNL